MLNSGSASKNKRCLSRPAVIWKKCVDNSHASASAERIELLDYETCQNLPAIRNLASERELSHDLLINTSSVINKFALLTDRKLQLLSQKWHIFSYNVIFQIYQYYIILIVFEAGLGVEH
jgi:hypothetical protein